MQYSIKEERVYYSQINAKFRRVSKLPLTIEEYINSFPSDTIKEPVHKDDHSPNDQSEETLIIQTTGKDADFIKEIYDKTYSGNYPYTEMLDLDYLQDYLNGEKNLVCGYASNNSDQVAGCGTMTVDPNKKIGYMRGLMLLPDFRTQIDVKKCVNQQVRFGYLKYYKNANRWYTETRTAHVKAQYLMEMVGCRPCAIFPNKDDFSGGRRRESDVLDVAYTHRALYKLRDESPKLLLEFKPLYELMKERYGFKDANYLKANNMHAPAANRFPNKHIHKKIDVDCENGNWNTHSITISGSNESKLQFTLTDTVMSAENSHFIYETYEELDLLLSGLKSVFVNNQLEYFEVYIPTSDVNVQKMFLNQGFSVFGYVPAWKESQSTGLLQDCIVFGYYNKPLDESKLNFTPASEELYQILNSLLI